MHTRATRLPNERLVQQGGQLQRNPPREGAKLETSWDEESTMEMRRHPTRPAQERHHDHPLSHMSEQSPDKWCRQQQAATQPRARAYGSTGEPSNHKEYPPVANILCKRQTTISATLLWRAAHCNSKAASSTRT